MDRRVLGEFGFSVDSSERGPDCCALWIDEGTEDAVGDEGFAELRDRLAVTLHHSADSLLSEDREVLLVRASRTSATGVLDALVTLVDLSYRGRTSDNCDGARATGASTQVRLGDRTTDHSIASRPARRFREG